MTPTAETVRASLKKIANVRKGVGSMRGLVLIFLKDADNEAHAAEVAKTGAKVVHRGFYVLGKL